MAKYKRIDMSPRFVAVDWEEQLLPGTFAHTVHHLVDELDLSAFDQHYRNDVTGAMAYAPSILLKAILVAYSHGIISSRDIARTCRNNVLFMTFMGDAAPDFTTFAAFVSRSRDAITSVFTQVIAFLDDAGMIGRELFAIDGVKLPSNASKYRSGTRAEMIAKAEKLEAQVQKMIALHQAQDSEQTEEAESRHTRRIARHTALAKRYRDWLTEHPDDKRRPSGRVRKSNLTDNESAKISTDKGVVQGYCGAAVVDAKHQVIVEASAHGTGSEQELLMPLLDACADIRTPDTIITADTGYYSENNLAALNAANINALIPDNGARDRDERFDDRQKHKRKKPALHLQTRGKPKPRSGLFAAEDFIIASDMSHAICPGNQRLYRNGNNCLINGYRAVRFRAPDAACRDCALRAQCLRKPDSTATRQLAVMTRDEPMVHTLAMRERLATPEGREQYGRRMGAVEPVFGNIRHNKGMNRFTLRGQEKVDGQWKLYALVHNIEKLSKHWHERGGGGQRKGNASRSVELKGKRGGREREEEEAQR